MSTSSTFRHIFYHNEQSFRPLNDNELHILIVKSGILYPESDDRETFLTSINWGGNRPASSSVYMGLMA